jgi:hypothetical protein
MWRDLPLGKWGYEQVNWSTHTCEQFPSIRKCFASVTSQIVSWLFKLTQKIWRKRQVEQFTSLCHLRPVICLGSLIVDKLLYVRVQLESMNSMAGILGCLCHTICLCWMLRFTHCELTLVTGVTSAWNAAIPPKLNLQYFADGSCGKSLGSQVLRPSYQSLHVQFQTSNSWWK